MIKIITLRVLFFVAFLLPSSQVVSQSLTMKLKDNPALWPHARDTSDMARKLSGLLGEDTVGNAFGGLGMTGTGQGGAGSGVGTLGLGSLSSTQTLGYGSGSKKENAKSPGADASKTSGKQTTSINKAADQTGFNDQVRPITSMIDEKEMVTWLDNFKRDPRMVSAKDYTNVDIKQDFFQKSNHPKELPRGTYVIAQQFTSEAMALQFAYKLMRFGFNPNIPGFVNQSGKWYVCLDGPVKVKQGKTVIERYREMKIFEDAWLLTVD